MASPNTSTNGQIQPRANGAAAGASSQLSPQKQRERSVIGLVQAMAPEIARALPKHVSPDRMARVCLTAFRTTPKLMECSDASLLAALMASAQLGLEPNTPLGHCYLIPYKTTCQLIIGYQGMIDLAIRSGRVTSIKAAVVRKGDRFEFEQGLVDKLVHVPCGDEDAPVTHVYAIAKIKDGDPVFTVLSRPQIEKRRKRGASGKNVSTPWDTDYDAMAMKTAVRALFKWIPKSAEMASASVIEDAQEKHQPISHALPDIAESIATAGLREQAIDATGYDTETGEVVDCSPTESELAAKIDRGEV